MSRHILHLTGGGGGGGGQPPAGVLGAPPDGTYTDGIVQTWVIGTTTVEQAIDDLNEIILALHPMLLAPYLGETNVVGDGRINFSDLVVAYISESAGAYNDNDWQGTQKDTTNIVQPSWRTIDKVSGLNNGAVINLEFNTVVVDTLVIAGTANQSSPGGMIQVTDLEQQMTGSYKGYIHVIPNHGTLLLNGGYARCHVKHTFDNILKQDSKEYLYDDGVGIVITNVSLSENTPVFKHLSGVRFYANGSILNVLSSANNVFAKGYVEYPLVYQLTEFGAPDLSVIYSDLGASSPPVWNEVANHTGQFTINLANTFDTDPRVTAKYKDQFATVSADSALLPRYLVCTYTNVSTDKNDYFLDENYRLPPGDYNTVPTDIIGQWDSTQNITTYQDGNGLQCFSKLTYPTTDFSVDYMPSNNPNYSGLTNNRTFYRALRDNGKPRSNLRTLRLQGVTYSDIAEGSANQKMRVEIKLPSATGWLNVGKYFSAGDFVGADNNGCLVAVTDNDFDITFGTFSTYYSGYMIILRITSFSSSAPAVTELHAQGWI